MYGQAGGFARLLSVSVPDSVWRIPGFVFGVVLGLILIFSRLL